MIDRYAEDRLTPEQVLEAFSDELPVEDHLRRFRVFRRPIDEVVEYRELSPTLATVAVRCEGRAATMRLRLTDDGRHLIRVCGLGIDPAPGVTIRPVIVEQDGPALRELELRCPVVTGDVAVTYDRGEDYFAQQRLMGGHFQSVAEYEGRVVGTFAESLRPLRVAGAERLASYRFHLRVDPSCRGLGIFPALNLHQSGMIFDAVPTRPLVTVFTATENHAMLQTASEAVHELRWRTQVQRLVLDCAENAGPPAGRPATQRDAGRIAELLDATHGREELAPVFDADHVRQRMARSPMDYSWVDVLLGERAVVGVWDQRLGIAKERDGVVERSVRACTIDWGCEPGGEDELLALLRAWCGRLDATGTTHLQVFTSAASPGRGALDALAPVVEPFLVSLAVPEPVDVVERGVFVDPIWF